MTRPPSRDELTFLALWRKLARGESVPPLTFSTPSQAMSVRIKAYNTIRPYREGKKFDVELEHAADQFSIIHRGNTLTFQKKQYLNTADDIMAQAGLTEEDLKSPEQLEVEAAINNMADASIPNVSEIDFSALVAKYATKEEPE